MKRHIVVCLVSLTLSAPVWAQGQSKEQDPSKQQQESAATGGAGMPMDMSKMGPWTRKPTNEAQTKKEIQRFFDDEEALMKKGDFEGTLARIDFPVFMGTDNSKGEPMAEEWDRQRYTQEMKPTFEKMPKDVKVNHKHDITVLSDSLAAYTDNYTMTMGKQKMSGRNAGFLVKRDGQWKWKAMMEAGWGDMPQQGVGGSGQEPKPMEPKPMEPKKGDPNQMDPNQMGNQD